MPNPLKQISFRSRVGLDGAAFFQAEAAGVLMPFLSNFLRQHGWSYGAIGVAVAMAGLGTFLMQTPAGFVIDRVRNRRLLFALASLAVGLCFAVLPLVARQQAIVDGFLFISGAAAAFFIPLLGALALALVGHRALQRAVGENRAWNHAGNIAAALLAMGLMQWLAVSSIFYAAGLVSALAALSVYLIAERELDEKRLTGRRDDGRVAPVAFRELLRERPVRVLFLSTALFHLANAPVMPLVALYLKRNGGSDFQVASVVLVAQVVMVLAAWLTGWASERWGRKPIFAVAFIVLPVRILLYSFVDDPVALVALQALDGIGSGIYGVAIVSMCADLTAGKGHFSAMLGMMATALAIGGVIGPIGAGWLAEHFGFAPAFRVFALIAAAAAVVFEVWMPETMPRVRGNHLKAVA